MENIVVCVTKMEESSRNVQFFLRAVRKDVEFSNRKVDSLLEYSCFQTKNGLSIKECIDRAVFESQFLLRFFGLESSDLVFQRFTTNELQVAKAINGHEDCTATNIQSNEYKYFTGEFA